MLASLLARFVGMSIWVLGLVFTTLGHSMAWYMRQQALLIVEMASQQLGAKPAGSSRTAP